MSEWMTEVSHYSEDQLNAIVLHFDVKFHFDWMIESMRMIFLEKRLEFLN